MVLSLNLPEFAQMSHSRDVIMINWYEMGKIGILAFCPWTMYFLKTPTFERAIHLFELWMYVSDTTSFCSMYFWDAANSLDPQMYTEL